ncbi:uncharacterized protein LOC106133744 [Amyelois transitella]|uniref:uncharacterized protein LOC106133744 n=1 Tax=Amyelois transitella TaxID=680683 RepID=UPI00067B7330|nr:uncharacterized protein LOC106133744 [Amyelois transitella]
MSTKLSPYDSNKQDENLAKLVMSAFYKLTQSRNGTTSDEIARYLRENFGDVWRTSVLTSKAEQTLSRSAALGFLDQFGKRYAVKIKGACCRRPGRRKCGCPWRRRRLRNCIRRRRRKRSCRKRRRRKRCSCS